MNGNYPRHTLLLPIRCSRSLAFMKTLNGQPAANRQRPSLQTNRCPDRIRPASAGPTKGIREMFRQNFSRFNGFLWIRERPRQEFSRFVASCRIIGGILPFLLLSPPPPLRLAKKRGDSPRARCFQLSKSSSDLPQLWNSRCYLL